MITITRAQARRLGLVFRRAPLGIAPRGPLPPLVLTAGGRRLRANFQHGGIAVEFAETGSDPAGEAISLPLEALTACAGRGDAPVAVEAAAADRTAVRWEEYGVPQVREYPVTPADALPPFPGPPAEWADNPDGLLDGLRRGDRHGRRPVDPLRPGLLAPPRLDRRADRHRRPPAPEPRRAPVPLGRRRSDPPLPGLRRPRPAA